MAAWSHHGIFLIKRGGMRDLIDASIRERGKYGYIGEGEGAMVP
jgi:hypothetical protein